MKPHDTAFINMLHVQAERGRRQHDPNHVNEYALNFVSRAENSFVDAYVEKGEPEWDKLKMIFEPNEEPAVQVVYDISSGEKENIARGRTCRGRGHHKYFEWDDS
ncbi:hypothetical protein Salat_2550800 [Sesamum alatum]|uniref:Uncharacterized protein n=1 Tax=Sesamum alatum TaxID=300844 RepID=A0AAE1XTC2_9LAMI|nr:hypothetical protein Salat_2550800 [Sesamum alatum]